MRQAVQYRLVEQVMKVLAVEVVTETQWKEVLQTICRVVCPELSRTRKLLPRGIGRFSVVRQHGFGSYGETREGGV